MMIIIAWVLLILGVVSIALGFGRKYDDASVCGAVFFVGGWLLIGLDRIAWNLQSLRAALMDRKHPPEASDAEAPTESDASESTPDRDS